MAVSLTSPLLVVSHDQQCRMPLLTRETRRHLRSRDRYSTPNCQWLLEEKQQLSVKTKKQIFRDDFLTVC